MLRPTVLTTARWPAQSGSWQREGQLAGQHGEIRNCFHMQSGNLYHALMQYQVQVQHLSHPGYGTVILSHIKATILSKEISQVSSFCLRIPRNKELSWVSCLGHILNLI